MSDYFRHARIVGALARVGAQDGAAAGGAEPRVVARRHPVPRPDSGGARSVDRGLPRSRRPSTPARRSPRKRSRASSSTSIGTAPTISSPSDASRKALLRLLKPRARPLRASVGDARLRSARPRVSGVPGDFVAGGARLLPQVHGGRAHAADDSQSGTPVGDDGPVPPASSERAQRAGGAGAAGARAAAARRRQVARRRSRDRKRADGARRRSIGCSSPARRARPCCF